MGEVFSSCCNAEESLGNDKTLSSPDDEFGEEDPYLDPSLSYYDTIPSQSIKSATSPSMPIVIQENNSTSASQASSSSFQINRGGFFLKYDLRDVIGVGSTSTCHRCIRKADGCEFACKVIDKRQIEVKFTGLLDQFFIEIKVLKMLEHPNIIHLEDAYETNDRIYMVMDIMSGGELFDYVVEKGTLKEEEAAVLVRKITSAVAHMHSMDIIHRDLKPENLLLTSKTDDAEVKLIDFGLAKIMVMNESMARSFLGTKGYLAPEMLQRTAYDKAIDIWALGVIVFVLLCGCLPFDDDSSKIASESDARRKFILRFPRWAMNLSPSAKDLLHNLLDINPKTRFTAEQALNHPWVQGKGVTANNFLQSPGRIGERRLELRSPMTPRMQAVQNRMRQTGTVNGTQLDAIAEEPVTKRQQQRSRNADTDDDFVAPARKNSI